LTVLSGGPAAARPVVAVVGATATGKSALAMALAAGLAGGGEIVNADALQVYRGFDIGTAKPSRADRERVPHHLIDILDPAERYSAGEFARRARLAIAGIRERGRWPVVVGGSGLYLRALLSGISRIGGEPDAGEPGALGDPGAPGDSGGRVAPGAPSRQRRVRDELRLRVEREGLAPLFAELARRDPPTAARLPPGDTQRVLRALEVVLVSGRPLSTWIAEQPFGIQSIAAIRVGLTLARGILYDRITGRVARMVDGGWTEEVRGLLARGLDAGLPAFQAIGYRQFVQYVRGEWPLARAIDETVRATRRFAKRQETWFRKEPDVTWFSAEDPDRRIPQVLEHVERGFGEVSA
jgi:tRNA dimethylallyltransferase